MSVLVVDLDRTLVRTDVLYEQAFKFLRKNPLNGFVMAWWMIKGGSLGLKIGLSRFSQPIASTLPYRPLVIDLIRTYKERKYVIVLASASPRAWVEDVGRHLGLFDHVIGSENANLKGLAKYEQVRDKLGFSEFVYVGDSKSDLPIWLKCKSAIAVNASSSTLSRLKSAGVEVTEITDRPSRLRQTIRQMRIYQWVKNLLIFLPMALAHDFNETFLVASAFGFLSFCFAASSVYILNDLADIDSDRKHHSKKNRPLAAGTLGIDEAGVALLLSTASALFLGSLAGSSFLWVLLIYWILNFAYSAYLKKEVILDIVLLAGMYTIRLFAGSAATGVVLSHWLLAFSHFFFFSLAALKRYTEIQRSPQKLTIDGRGYRKADQFSVLVMGIGTGLISVLIFILYIQSPDLVKYYPHRENLWIVAPVLLYWFSRLWLLGARDEVHDDPVLFAIKDRVSWLCLLLIGAVLVSAAAL